MMSRTNNRSSPNIIVPLDELQTRLIQMSLSKDLVERFQAIYVIKQGVVIGYTEAESRLKDLAELVRLTSSENIEVQHA